MADIFPLKYGATLPSLITTLSYSGGAADLTGCSGIIKMRHQFGHEFSKSVIILDQTTYPKQIEIDWENAEVITFNHGIYYVEYHITFPSGKLAIFPTEGEVTYDRIEIQPSL